MATTSGNTGVMKSSDDSFGDVIQYEEYNKGEQMGDIVPQQLREWTREGYETDAIPQGDKPKKKKKTAKGKKSKRKQEGTNEDKDQVEQEEAPVPKKSQALRPLEKMLENNQAAMDQVPDPVVPEDDIETVFPIKVIAVCEDEGPESPIGQRTTLSKRRRLPPPPPKEVTQPHVIKKPEHKGKQEAQLKQQQQQQQQQEPEKVGPPKTRTPEMSLEEHKRRFPTRPDSWRFSRYFNTVLEEMKKESEEEKKTGKKKKRKGSGKFVGKKGNSGEFSLTTAALTENTGTTTDSGPSGDDDDGVEVNLVGEPEETGERKKTKSKKGRRRSVVTSATPESAESDYSLRLLTPKKHEDDAHIADSEKSEGTPIKKKKAKKSKKSKESEIAEEEDDVVKKENKDSKKKKKKRRSSVIVDPPKEFIPDEPAAIDVEQLELDTPDTNKAGRYDLEAPGDAEVGPYEFDGRNELSLLDGVGVPHGKFERDELDGTLEEQAFQRDELDATLFKSALKPMKPRRKSVTNGLALVLEGSRKLRRNKSLDSFFGKH